MRNRITSVAIATVAAAAMSAQAAVPIPIGQADVTFTYMTDTGPRVLSSSVDYSGTGPGDAVPLGGDPSIGYFNSVNSFGRRMLVDGGLREDESLLTHSFFKPPDHSGDFFADIVPGGLLTLEVQNIQFAEPTSLQLDTVMQHKFWDADQVDQLDDFYFNMHNHDTGTDPFRDFDEFFPFIFSDFPLPTYQLGVLSGDNAIEVFGDGTQTLGFRITLPYDRLKNFEETGQEVPPGLPAPFGFLEPFHFHVEFAVRTVPEPGSAMILLAALSMVMRRR